MMSILLLQHRDAERLTDLYSTEMLSVSLIFTAPRC
uniref:Uncharacterized protein n=1 Tax=Anguilla anguilla TaxID=7936 RepID=A0A0E9W1V9_ANGAN